MSSSCLPTPTSPAALISSPTQLAQPTPSTWVTRSGTRLLLDGESFKAVGPNVYWLGLDENVAPYATYPTKDRVLEVMAIASTMGATTIRSTTLGVSFGYDKSVEPSLGNLNEAAFESIDWAIYSAKQYGLRLVIPLVDQYNYYHGGIPTWLRWNNLSTTNHSPFYDVNGTIINQFKSYISTLLNHRSNLTQLTMGQEPTILAFETGNELGGWGGNNYPPPVAWTTEISSYIKSLAPNALVISGSYGVKESELGIPDVDIYSDHYYPPYSYNLKKAASLASSHDKAFLAGEFDWTDRYYKPLIYLVVLIPVLLAASLWAMPARWWPWRIGCSCCGRRRKKEEIQQHANYESVVDEKEGSTVNLSRGPNTFPPTPLVPTLVSPTSHRRWTFPSAVFIQRWHVALAILAIAPILAGIISVFLPTPLTKFLGTLESLSNQDQLAGDMYWSLFGRDDNCCQYVQHNDGYTLHFSSTPDSSDMQRRAATLTQHAWKMRGVNPSWPNNIVTSNIGVSSLPSIACPQAPLTLPANATWTGGNGTIS